MKKAIIVTSVVIAVAIAAAVSIRVFKVFTITDPYLIKPMTVLPAPKGAQVGHTINTKAQTLSVFSSNAVLVVADPGVSFQYVVLWLVEKPRKDKSGDLLEYRCELPKYAVAEHINALDSKLPPQIQAVADGNQWR